MKYLLIFFVLISFSSEAKKKRVEKKVKISLDAVAVGTGFELEFQKGKSFYHPTFAVWVEDLDSNYLESVYVTRYVAKGIFGRASLGSGKWSTTAGEARRPATLPYWSHKRGIKASDSLYIPSPQTAVPDAYTSATPQNNFIINSKFSEGEQKFRVLFEINQPWDSNRFWNNSKYKGDLEYYASLQPALVYEAIIDLSGPKNYEMKIIGHSHPSGANGQLFKDVSKFTTALNIAEKIIIRIK